MDLRLTEDELAFRTEVRAFLRDNLPASIREKGIAGRKLSKDDYVRWTRILADKGWAVPFWPKQWGGTGWSPIKQSIFLDETQRGHAPEAIAFGVNIVGPIIYTFAARRRRRSDSWRASSICATGGARTSRSPAPDPTSRAFARARDGTAIPR